MIVAAIPEGQGNVATKLPKVFKFLIKRLSQPRPSLCQLLHTWATNKEIFLLGVWFPSSSSLCWRGFRLTKGRYCADWDLSSLKIQKGMKKKGTLLAWSSLLTLINSDFGILWQVPITSIESFTKLLLGKDMVWSYEDVMRSCWTQCVAYQNTFTIHIGQMPKPSKTIVTPHSSDWYIRHPNNSWWKSYETVPIWCVTVVFLPFFNNQPGFSLTATWNFERNSMPKSSQPDNWFSSKGCEHTSCFKYNTNNKILYILYNLYIFMLVYVRISCIFSGETCQTLKKSPLLDTKQFHHCFKGSLMWCPTFENYTWKDDKILRPNAYPMKKCHTSLMLKVYRIPWRCL